MAIESFALTARENNEVGRVESLVPVYLRENAEKFIAFLKHYYTFMSKTGSVSAIQLSYRGNGYISNLTNVATRGGHGTGLTVDITINNATGISTLEINRPGFGYEVGDLIYVEGTDFAIPTIRDLNTVNLDETVNYDYYEFDNANFYVTEIVASPTNVVNNILDEHDINETREEYLDNLQTEVAKGIPNAPRIDKRTLFKNIVKYYNSRGSFDSIHTFFKVFHDEEITLRNDEDPFTYIITTYLQAGDWEETYKNIVHPAGMKYIIELIVQAFADNDFNAGSIVIPEGSDTMDLSIDTWIKQLIVDRGSHTPTLQPGWLKRVLQLLVSVYVESDELQQEALLSEGYTTWTHETGLVMHKEGGFSFGNPNKFGTVEFNSLVVSSPYPNGNPTNRHPVFIGRKSNMCDSSVLGDIPSTSVHEGLSDISGAEFAWERGKEYILEFDYEFEDSDHFINFMVLNQLGALSRIYPGTNRIKFVINLDETVDNTVYFNLVYIDTQPPWSGGTYTSLSSVFKNVKVIEGDSVIPLFDSGISFKDASNDDEIEIPNKKYMEIPSDRGIKFDFANSYISLLKDTQHTLSFALTIGSTAEYPFDPNRYDGKSFKLVYFDADADSPSTPSSEIEVPLDNPGFSYNSEEGPGPNGMTYRWNLDIIFDSKNFSKESRMILSTGFDIPDKAEISISNLCIKKSTNVYSDKAPMESKALAIVDPQDRLGFTLSQPSGDGDGPIYIEVKSNDTRDRSVSYKALTDQLEYEGIIETKDGVGGARFISWETTFNQLGLDPSESPLEIVYTIDDFGESPILLSGNNILGFIAEYKHYGDYIKASFE